MNEEKQTKMNNFGLIPLPPDSRDFKLGQVFDLPKLSELPANFEHEPVFIGDQLQSFFCTGFAQCGASSLQEGEPLVPEYSYALSGKVNEEVSLIGYDLRTSAKGHTKFGALAEKDRPLGFKLGEKPDAFLADIKNWPDLSEKALEHLKASYLFIDGPYDAFDNIRAAIWKFREEKRSVVFGVLWKWPTDNPIIKDNPRIGGGGHALFTLGWKTIDELYLTVINSYGKNVGEGGKFYFGRKVINDFVRFYGALMFVDLTKEEYLKLAEERNKLKTKIGILQQIVEALKKLIAIFQKKKVEEIISLDEITVPEIIKETPKISRIENWALAIKVEEGWHPNSRSYKNQNPGNLKFSTLTKELGASSVDKDNFAVFPTYEVGFKALCDFLKLACEDKLKPYHQARTLYQFTQIYALPPTNHPYAQNVAQRLGVSEWIDIKNLL